MMAKIKEPFGDGITSYEVTSSMAINEAGEIAQDGEEIAYHQYEINGCFYAEQFLIIGEE